MGLFNKPFKSKRVDQSDLYRITLDNTTIGRYHPGLGLQEVKIAEIMNVVVQTTDQGPFAPDFWLIITSASSQCKIPINAEGYEAVYDEVTKFEGFDFNNYIAATTSTENAIFPVWQV